MEIQTTSRRESMERDDEQLHRVPKLISRLVSQRSADPQGITEPVGQRQALIHLFPKELSPFGRHGEGSMVQVSAEVAEGIADAALVVGGERRLRLCHGLILLGSLACH